MRTPLGSLVFLTIKACVPRRISLMNDRVLQGWVSILVVWWYEWLKQASNHGVHCKSKEEWSNAEKPLCCARLNFKGESFTCHNRYVIGDSGGLGGGVEKSWSDLVRVSIFANMYQMTCLWVALHTMMTEDSRWIMYLVMTADVPTTWSVAEVLYNMKWHRGGLCHKLTAELHLQGA